MMRLDYLNNFQERMGQISENECFGDKATLPWLSQIKNRCSSVNGGDSRMRVAKRIVVYPHRHRFGRGISLGHVRQPEVKGGDLMIDWIMAKSDIPRLDPEPCDKAANQPLGLICFIV